MQGFWSLCAHIRDARPIRKRLEHEGITNYMNRLILCGLFVAAGTYCRADIILSIDPGSQMVPLGSQLTVNLDIAGLGGGTALGTYDVNVDFGPTLLAYDSIVFGNQVDISGLGDIQLVTQGTGTVEVFELSLDSPSDLSAQASAFTLATLTFDTFATGSNSPVTLSVNALGDAFGNSITADLQNGSVTISAPSAVPEPAAISLFGAGLFLIVGLRLRQPYGKSH
jgi:hypothetical protein